MDNVNIPNPPQVPPTNYLVFAILTTLFCFLPTGIVAIIYATKVNTLWHAQAYGEAYDASRKAKNWCIISAAVGALIWIVYALLGVAFAGDLAKAGY